LALAGDHRRDNAHHETWQFLPFIAGDIHQFNRIDTCDVGGFTEAMKVAGWSEAH
jgi:galactonate dehydratase